MCRTLPGKVTLRYSIHAVLLSTSLSIAHADELDPLADDLLFEDIPIVFSASKYEQKISEAPSSVHIITDRDIEQYGWQTLMEVLDSVPGFYTSYDYAYGYVGSGGFSRPGDYNARYLFLLDGVRINDAIYDAEGVVRESIVNVDMIDRVEVISGPGSSLYGSSAFLGVVNIVTKDGQDFQGTEVAMNLAENASREMTISYGNRTSNGIDFVVSGQFFDSDGSDKLYVTEFDDPATNNGFAVNVDNQESRNLFGKVSYQDLEVSFGFYGRDKVVPTASYDTLFNSALYQLKEEKLSLGAQYTYDFNNTMMLVTRFAYNQYDYMGDYPYDYADPGDPLDLAIWEDKANGEFWLGETTLTKRFERHTLVAGLEYIDFNRQDQKSYDPYYTYIDDKQSTNRVGVYFQDDFSVTERLSMTLGGRFDKQANIEDGELNPRLAFRYRLGGDENLPSSLRLSYGTAFRAPNAYEQYYNDDSNTHKPAMELSAETLDTVELSWEHYFSPALMASASIFRYEIKDLIELVEDPADELLVFENRSSAEAQGVEFSLDGRLAENINALVSYSYVDAEDGATGEQLSNSPKHLAKINLSMPLWADYLRAGIEARYASKRAAITGGYVDGATTANLNLRSEEILPGLSLSARLINVFDEDVWHPVGPEHWQDSLLQPGRTYQLNILYRF